jgi:chromosome segregation ATPase
MFISYSAVVQKEKNTKMKQKSQNMGATTAASTISGTSETGPVFEGINDLKKKLAEMDAERNRYSSQHQKVEDDVTTLMQSMHKMASDIIDIHKDMHGLRTQMKEITDILKKIKYEASRYTHDCIAPS